MLAAVIYLVLRFCLSQQIEEFGTIYLYAMECAFGGFALVYYRNDLRKVLKFPPSLIYLPIVSMLAGLCIAYGATVIGLPIPFDVHNAGGVAMLLLVAPILEELLFRFLLWMPLANRGKSSWAWSFTTLIFAYAHWHAVWAVPEEWHGFLAYQTLYTLLLGLVCGAMVYRLRSLTGAMLIHFGFNLGFWLMLAI